MMSAQNDWRPRFIVIGAVKAATTWIQAQLQSSPHIFMPDPEPHYFSRDYDKGEEYYRKFFSGQTGDHHLTGEKSADYLAHPEAPRRIAKDLPDVRLVVQLRDPVERAYSDYKMLYRRGTIRNLPECYLRGTDCDYPRFLHDGLYGQHLRNWLDVFPRERILAFRYEDVARQPQQIVENVCRHIGAPAFYDALSARKRENNSSAALLPLPLRTALSPFKRAVKPLRGSVWFERTRSVLAREIEYPPLDDDLRCHMEDFYREDISLASQLLDIDLSAWEKDWANRHHSTLNGADTHPYPESLDAMPR
ncbi:MAG: sulfotransferase family protein [Sphingomonadaceae bacterium]